MAQKVTSSTKMMKRIRSLERIQEAQMEAFVGVAGDTEALLRAMARLAGSIGESLKRLDARLSAVEKRLRGKGTRVRSASSRPALRSSR